MKFLLQYLSIILLITGVSFTAPKKEGGPKKQNDKGGKPKIIENIDPDGYELIITYLKNRYHLDQSIERLKQWSPGAFEKHQINELLVDILISPTTSKNTRLAIVDLFKTSFSKRSLVRSKLIAILIKNLDNIYSPSLSSSILEFIFSAIGNQETELEKARTQLMQEITKDILANDSVAKYSSQDHVVALKALGKSTPDSKSIDLLNSIISKKFIKDEGVPSVRIAFYQTLDKLTKLRFTATPILGKTEKKNILKYLHQLLGQEAERLHKEPKQITEDDLIEIEFLMKSIENILSDPEVTSYRKESYISLIKILSSKTPNLVKLAGEYLINTKSMEIRNRIKGLELRDILQMNTTARFHAYKIAKKTQQENPQNPEAPQDPHALKDFNNAKDLATISLELLVRYIDVIIASLDGQSEKKLTGILKYLNNQFIEEKEVHFKNICLSAFVNLDAGILQHKSFPISSLQIVKKMFEDGIAIMKIPVQRKDPDKKENIEKLQESMANMMAEMTGHDYGINSQAWEGWLNGAGGERYFKRLK
ncbi:MAG: hypothetical protein HQL32_16740 [Planctomycetes bacterium]|nr:hypothetical protein [Planctomycetota bacterium]